MMNSVNNTEVSIVIPTYNRLSTLTKTIESILKQKNNKFEIIVVDDMSTDGTCENLKKKFGQVRVISTKKRSGPSHARNIGIAEAGGAFIWFLDSDVVLPDDDLLNRMILSFNDIAGIGSIGGEIVAHESLRERAYGRKVLWNADNKRVVAYENDGIVECDYLATCNCFTKKELVIKLGGFDERFVFGAEDMDFGIRLKKLGLKNYIKYNLAVYHFHEKTGRYNSETTYYQKTRIQFAKKHYGKINLFIMFFVDLLNCIKFYICMLPKLLGMLFLQKKIIKQNVFGGWFKLKFYFNL